MRRRVLGLVASLVLALFGTAVLVVYVQSAAEQAAAGEATTGVLVVKQIVPKGTPVAELERLVELRQVPKTTKADGALDSTTVIRGQVAAIELVPGEQVLAKRFQSPEKLGRAGVPDGPLEVTIALDAQRAVGGDLKPGDTVGVIASYEPFDLDAAGLPPAPPGAATKTPNSTHLILRKVLVSNVQGKVATTAKQQSTKEDDEKEGDGLEPKPAPEGQLLVTLALDATAVERVVFAAEYGTLWLSAEPKDAPDGGTRIETRGIALR
jgi:pilus assembly protein CpaB